MTLDLESKMSPIRTLSSGRELIILSFHNIGEPSASLWGITSWFYIPEATFAGYLSYLHEEGWQVIGLEAFLRGLTAPNSLPERAVLLTFDDGYRSMLSVALPWLLRFGYPAVLFVPSDFVGGSNTFDADIEPEEEICDWDDLRELERQGVSVQSHGASHRAFSYLPLAEQEEELRRSKAALEAGLGKTVEVFSYPYGDGGEYPQELSGMMQLIGYQAGCLYRGGLNRLPVSNPYRLTRLAMGPKTDLPATLGTKMTSSGGRGQRLQRSES
jgi:peptidoglycan/xylan/chitin deacetylase (PgdA/CDA1 family)